jgi:Ras-related protein Rab-6A
MDAQTPTRGVGANNVKVVILGDADVGKTCLMHRFVYGAFSETSHSTIGIDFLRHTLQLEDGRAVRMNLWDTAWQERFRSMVPSYIRDAHVALIVYDITSRVSFENAARWVQDARNGALDGAVLALVGNKKDLAAHRLVPTSEGKSLAETEGCQAFFEASAKSGDNVQQLFQRVAEVLPVLLGEKLSGVTAANHTDARRLSQTSASGTARRKRQCCA